MRYIGGLSGGIDSQAACNVMIERHGPENVWIVNTQAGRNEHPVTVSHVAWYSDDVHHVEVVTPKLSDVRTLGWIERKGFDPETELTFELMAKIKGRFPSTKAQFCTEWLKLAPIRRWMRETFPDGDYTRFSGVRNDESRNRADRREFEWDDYFDCDLVNPVVTRTKQWCFNLCRDLGQVINPLYSLGFERVGCAPCVNSGKDDVLAWHQRAPEMLDKVRGWEKSVGRTFFPPMVPGLEINWIDDVIAWAYTSRGGRQTNLLRVLNERPSCESRFGLCE